MSKELENFTGIKTKNDLEIAKSRLKKVIPTQYDAETIFLLGGLRENLIILKSVARKGTITRNFILIRCYEIIEQLQTQFKFKNSDFEWVFEGARISKSEAVKLLEEMNNIISFAKEKGY